MDFKNKMKETFGSARVSRLNNLDQYMRGYKAHQREFKNLDDSRVCAMVGMANYGNIGDLAISEAQLQFLHANFDGIVVEIPTTHFWEYERLLKEHLTSNSVICYQGGGNMSDLYPWFEYERCAIMEVFPDQRNIIMPQTLSYRDENVSLLNYSKRTYANCTDLHLFARESKSEDLMKRIYPSTDVQLVPDIVLSLDAKPYVDTVERRDVLTIMLRQDDERSLTAEDWGTIHTGAEQLGLPIEETDTIIETMNILPTQRRGIVSRMLRIFASSRIVVTDRLHGMIFAAITGTPCVVLSNSNHKIRGVYQWIKDLPYIRFIEDSSMIGDALNEVMGSEMEYPLEMMRAKFGPLKECINANR